MSKRADGERNADLNRLREYLQEPRTMKRLTSWMNVDRRTIFRYMEDLGVPISRVGLGRPTEYRIP